MCDFQQTGVHQGSLAPDPSPFCLAFKSHFTASFIVFLTTQPHRSNTSFVLQEKEVTITMPSGETTVATVRIWNETVSNLTLMALGSSAPEILLSVIEVSYQMRFASNTQLENCVEKMIHIHRPSEAEFLS